MHLVRRAYTLVFLLTFSALVSSMAGVPLMGGAEAQVIPEEVLDPEGCDGSALLPGVLGDNVCLPEEPGDGNAEPTDCIPITEFFNQAECEQFLSGVSEAPNSDLTDGYSVYINPIDGRFLPSDLDFSDLEDRLDGADYEHTLLIPDTDGVYRFWVYAEALPALDDLGEDGFPARWTNDEDSDIEHTDIGEVNSAFAIYDVSSFLVDGEEPGIAVARDDLTPVWECNGGCNEYIVGGQLHVPASEVEATGPVTLWSFIDVDREPRDSDGHDSASAWYSFFKGDLEGYAAADLFDYHYTPVILGDATAGRFPSADGHFVDFDFTLPAVSASEGGFTVDFTVYRPGDAGYELSANTPVELFFQLDCGALPQEIPLCEANQGAEASASGTTDGDGVASLTISTDDAEDAGLFFVDGLPASMVHVMVNHNGVTSHYHQGADTLWAAGFEVFADAFEQSGFTPVLISDLPASGLDAEIVLTQYNANDGELVEDDSTRVSESGTSDTYSVQLASMPQGLVTVEIDATGTVCEASDDSPQLLVARRLDAQAPPQEAADRTATLVFTPFTWDQEQLLEVFAVDDLCPEASPHVVTISHLSTSFMDEAFDALEADLEVTIVENGLPALRVFRDAGGEAGSELLDGNLAAQLQERDDHDTSSSGNGGSVWLALETEPQHPVGVLIDVSNREDFCTGTYEPEGTTCGDEWPMVAVFYPSNFGVFSWDEPQQVSFFAADDAFDEGLEVHDITFAVSSEDDAYNDLANRFFDVEISDVDVAAIQIEDAAGNALGSDDFAITVTEADDGAEPAGSFDIYFDAPAAHDITVTLTWPQAEFHVNGDATGSLPLTFAAGSADTPQTLVVTAVDDLFDEEDEVHAVGFEVSSESTDRDYTDAGAADVTVVDDDTQGFVLDGTDDLVASEDGAQAPSFTVVATAQPEPGQPFTVTVSNGDGQLLVATDGTPAGSVDVVFTDSAWGEPRTVTISAVDNSVDEGDDAVARSSSLTVSHANGADDDETVPVDIRDDDSVSIVVQTAANGACSDVGGVQHCGVALSPEGDDAPGSESSYKVKLSHQPGFGDIRVDLTLVDDGLGQSAIEFSTDGATWVTSGFLTFTADDWNVGKTVLVRPVADDASEEDKSYAITHAIDATDYPWMEEASVSVQATVTDDDIPGLTLDAGDGLVVAEGGAGDTFSVFLNTAPSAVVTVTIAAESSEVEVGDDGTIFGASTTLTFDETTWATPQTVHVGALDDFDIEGVDFLMDAISVAASSDDADYEALQPVMLDVTVHDNDGDFTLVLTDGTNKVTEGGATDTFDVVLASTPSDDVTMTVSHADGEVEFSVDGGPFAASVQFVTADTNHVTVTVRAVDDGLIEGVETVDVTVVAASNDPSYDGRSKSTTVDVTSDDAAGIVCAAGCPVTLDPESDGGDQSDAETYAVTLAAQPVAEVTLELAVGDLLDDAEGIEISTDGETWGPTATLVFAGADWDTPQDVHVRAIGDDGVEGDLAYTIAHTVAEGSDDAFLASTLDVTATVVDDDNAGISLLAGDGLSVMEGGATDTFDVILASQPFADVTVTLTDALGEVLLSDDGSAYVASLELVFTPTNWDSVQVVHVQAVDDEDAEGTVVDGASIGGTAASADASYDALAAGPIGATIVDNDGGFVVTLDDVQVTEGDQANQQDRGRFDIALASEPTATVTVTIGNASGDVAFSTTESLATQYTDLSVQLDFNDEDWNVAQTVYLRAIDDTLGEGEEIVVAELVATSTDVAYEGVADGVDITVLDDDPPIVISKGTALAIGERCDELAASGDFSPLQGCDLHLVEGTDVQIDPLGNLNRDGEGAYFWIELGQAPQAGKVVFVTIQTIAQDLGEMVADIITPEVYGNLPEDVTDQLLIQQVSINGRQVESMVFTEANWDQPRRVYVQPVGDILPEPIDATTTHLRLVTSSADSAFNTGKGLPFLEVTIEDDDGPVESVEQAINDLILDPDGDDVMFDNPSGDGASLLPAGDQCAGTERGAPVDDTGCSVEQGASDIDGDDIPDDRDDDNSDGPLGDSDGDGVANQEDDCAATPQEEAADANGCGPSQRDTDNDGVTDNLDQCPGTDAGPSVDADGCAANQLDEDADDVANDLDQCPGTDAAASVDSDGCAANQRDSDGDGVMDDVDQCNGFDDGVDADGDGIADGCDDDDTDGPLGDSDGDGLANENDQCADTPNGEAADANGCSPSQLDTDGDGVTDDADQCPDTAAQASVNADGCSVAQGAADADGDGIPDGTDPDDTDGPLGDTDGDGVVNEDDDCATTPSDETADANGCSPSQSDADGDGVSDDADQCPDTETGASADADGCAANQLDEDADDVANDLDQCPGTDAAASVDSDGCAANQRDSDGDGVMDDVDQCNGFDDGVDADGDDIADGCDDDDTDGPLGDSDGDGVANEVDDCAGTDAGATVDEVGCAANQRDSDGDDVTDDVDQCPETDAGATVDGSGCASNQLDSDGDGVTDDVDLCPETDAGATVDADGCAANQRDTDDDGVTDDLDLCPATDAEAVVDADGCAANQRDTDADGVTDDLDLCPGTETGASVDESGCAASQRDTDGDSFADDVDQCPETAPGAAVNSSGCSADQGDLDLDGVEDEDDNCPNTANTDQGDADADGAGDVCDEDDDNDGVDDTVDDCPGEGEAGGVNAAGCSDEDGDGVADSDDNCPASPQGVPVDGAGCPDPAAVADQLPETLADQRRCDAFGEGNRERIGGVLAVCFENERRGLLDLGLHIDFLGIRITL